MRSLLNVTHNVATVVEHNVGSPKLSDNTLQKLPILLCPDADLDLVFLELLALGKKSIPTIRACGPKYCFHICKEPPRPQPISMKVTGL